MLIDIRELLKETYECYKTLSANDYLILILSAILLYLEATDNELSVISIAIKLGLTFIIFALLIFLYDDLFMGAEKIFTALFFGLIIVLLIMAPMGLIYIVIRFVF